jgi:NAD(P)-dependent dehydrogenase (short-subunit alcohol dehydrogenase family)
MRGALSSQSANARDRGLGAVICERFAARGCNIAINYVAAEDAAKEVEKSIKSQYEKAKVVTIKAVSLFLSSALRLLLVWSKPW